MPLNFANEDPCEKLGCSQNSYVRLPPNGSHPIQLVYLRIISKRFAVIRSSLKSRRRNCFLRWIKIAGILGCERDRAAHRWIRRIIRASRIIHRRWIHDGGISFLLPPLLSLLYLFQKKKKKKKSQATSQGWLTHWRCSISWLGFLRRRASLNSHWARSSFRNGAKVTRFACSIRDFLSLSHSFFSYHSVSFALLVNDTRKRALSVVTIHLGRSMTKLQPRLVRMFLSRTSSNYPFCIRCFTARKLTH